ncbi:MAG: hypothetical protein BalsKO_08630 [Balneolaceae bacterium]
MKLVQFFIVVGVFFICSNTVFAQKVTFNVNLKPELEDSTFIPGRDQIRIIGSVQPINLATPYYLTDQEPIDSVYSVTINFSPRLRNQTITYNFEMTLNYRKLSETLQRQLQIRQGEVSLDPLYFNAFAW